MTVGIILTNGLEAIMLSDCCANTNGRLSRSFNKLATFAQTNFHGAICGSGDGNILGGMKTELRIKSQTLDRYIHLLAREYIKLEDSQDRSQLHYAKREIRKRAIVVTATKSKKEFIESEIGNLLQQYSEHKEEGHAESRVLVAAYDCQEEKIRLFSIGSKGLKESFQDRDWTGSGRDASGVYFASKLNGVDTSKMTVEQMLYTVVNAYSLSSINEAVDGTPKIALLSSKGNPVLSAEKSRVLTNLSGAYMSELLMGQLTPIQIIQYFKQILGNNPRYDRIAKMLGMSEEKLTGTVIPYAAWQEEANQKIFNKKVLR